MGIIHASSKYRIQCISLVEILTILKTYLHISSRLDNIQGLPHYSLMVLHMFHIYLPFLNLFVSTMLKLSYGYKPWNTMYYRLIPFLIRACEILVQQTRIAWYLSNQSTPIKKSYEPSVLVLKYSLVLNSFMFIGNP